MYKRIPKPGYKNDVRPIRSSIVNGYKQPKTFILKILLLERYTYNSLQGIFTTLDKR